MDKHKQKASEKGGVVVSYATSTTTTTPPITWEDNGFYKRN